MAAIDIPKLAEEIKAIAPKYSPSNEGSTAYYDKEEGNPVFRGLMGLLRGIILNTAAKEPGYWKAGGIRMVPGPVFAVCFDKVKTKSKMLGVGYYGKVFNIPTNPCFDKVPAGVKHVGLKIENLKTDFDPNQVPERLNEVIKIAKKAGDLGIGPRLYDAFVTIGSVGQVQIIKLFEIIDGKSWANTEWTPPLDKVAALAKLDNAIHIMNKAGIIHHDLHGGNVMVSKSGDVYIIDYDMAKFAKNEEINRLGAFSGNDSRWEPKGAASNDGLAFVYQTLLKNGAIKLTEEANAVTKNKNKKARTRKAKQT